MGAIALFLGVSVPLALWIYEGVLGGNAGEIGFLGTILMFFLAPIGLGLLFVGWKKGQ